MPDWTSHLRQRLRALELRGEREHEIIEELSQHLDLRHQELLDAGHAEEEAVRMALDDLVAPDTLVESMRPLRQAQQAESNAPMARGASPWADLRADLLYAVRSLRRQPLFALVAILTLALGLGANSAMFALADATLLRALPLPQAERLVMLWESTPGNERGAVSPTNMKDWKERSRSIEAMAGHAGGVGSMVLANADGSTEAVRRQWVTAGIFDVLGLAPVLGRGFSEADDKAGLDSVVLSESYWRTRFAADPNLIGRDLRLDGDAYRVLGVVPDQARVIGAAELWALEPISTVGEADRGAHFLRVIARLSPQAERESAAAELNAIATELAHTYPATNRDRGVSVQPLREAVVGADLRVTAMLFLGVVGLVLLICCANVANLLLARGNARARELAVRTALGANRWRLARQILSESLLLAALGGGLGLLLGAGILAAAPALMPAGLLPAGVELGVDLRLVIFAVLASAVVGLLFGLAPVWQSARLAPASVIGSATRGSSARTGAMRNTLVVVELTLAVVLLFGAGLLLRTVLAMQEVDRGYRAEGSLTLLVDPLGDRYPTPASLLQFFDSIESEVQALGTVARVAWSSSLPLDGSSNPAGFKVPAAANAKPANAEFQIVSRNYMSALGIRQLSGRSFNSDDRNDSLPVCIVNDAFVRQHLSGIEPIGAEIAIGRASDPNAVLKSRRIVGVVAGVKAGATDTEAAPRIYVPLQQQPTDDLYLIVQPRQGSADSLAASVRAAIARVDTEQLVTVSDVLSLETIAHEATARQRFRATLVLAFAGLALFLALVGVFGILAGLVQQRARDFGVRMALGATARDVLLLVLRDGAVLISISAVCGLVCAVFTGRWLAAVLYQISPFDPPTFVAVIGVLALTSLLAMLGPAWRAARVAPAETLRSS